jgi:hypothetical protein
MGAKGQLHHLQRSFRIGARDGQPIHQLHAFVTLEEFDRDFLECITTDPALSQETSLFLKDQLGRLGYATLKPSQSTQYSARKKGSVKCINGPSLSYDYYRSADLLYNMWFIQRGNGIIRPVPNIQGSTCYYSVIALIAIFSNMGWTPEDYKGAKQQYINILNDKKNASMWDQLKREGSLLIDPVVLRKNYIAPGSFIRSVFPLLDTWFVKEIQSAPAKIRTGMANMPSIPMSTRQARPAPIIVSSSIADQGTTVPQCKILPELINQFVLIVM